jgi:uncharacterized membrane protein (DUF485 family)
MNHTPDNETITGNESPLDPQEAAALLDQTTQQARRRFEPSPPMLNVFRAFVVLVAFGGLWLSVRGQHPYAGPKPWALAITYGLVGIVIAWTARAHKRSGEGVSGPAKRARDIGMAVLLVGWVLVYVFEAAFYKTGASIIYGIYPATAPFLIVGLAAAAWAAGREEWPLTATMLGVAIVAAFAALAGPVYCWLIMGIGLCLAMVGNAAFGFRQQRRSVVRP